MKTIRKTVKKLAEQPINVTKPFLPPIGEYTQYLQEVWTNGWLTNNGPLVNELEYNLKKYLRLKNLLFVSNGTLAMQLAIKALDLQGEVITTPFSHISTSSSILWQGCTPVYADIDEYTLNINPNNIEALITPRTRAIMATHIFGNPCDIEAIEAIAGKYRLKVIYDAAHCFGCTYKGKSVFTYGDISTTSFHATKLFHTIEGGAVFTSNTSLLRKLSLLRNFGHNGPENFETAGINAKNSEMHAAMGLVNLKYADEILLRRRIQAQRYREQLQQSGLQFIHYNENAKVNDAYFPIIFENESRLLSCFRLLSNNGIFARRYFYPSLNNIGFLGNAVMPVSERISGCVMCLPLYHDLTFEKIDFISTLINQHQKK